MNIYLYDVGLRPASTKNGISIYHVEQAGLFPTTCSLQSRVRKEIFSTLYTLDIEHGYCEPRF